MFFIQKLAKQLIFIFVSLLVVGCSQPDQKIISKSDVSQSSNSLLTVYKRASCGCCSKWVKHIEENGFETMVHDQQDLSQFKLSKGIKSQYQSCHTAVSKHGYVFEGHIPAKLIQQFLNQIPKDAIGLAVPGMPMGSPGMEMNEMFFPYKVLLLKTDGSSEVYAEINTQEEQY